VIKKYRKKWTVSYLKKKVWVEFSKYIRMRDATPSGITSCVTCGKTGHYKTFQAGHFIPGRGNSILFDERGVHPQCYLCNGPLKGNPRKYEAFMKKKYGQKVIDKLDKLVGQAKKFTETELIDLWNYYKGKLKKI